MPVPVLNYIKQKNSIRQKKKKLLYWRNPTDPKIRPDPTFLFKKQNKKKNLILALKMLILGFETWLVA